MALTLQPTTQRSILLAGLHLDDLFDAIDHDERVQLIDLTRDAIAAVAIAGRTQPDVIVFDDCIDRFDAVSAAIAVRRVAPGSTIVLLTGDSNVERKARRAGVDSVYGKSVSLDALLDL